VFALLVPLAWGIGGCGASPFSAGDPVIVLADEQEISI